MSNDLKFEEAFVSTVDEPILLDKLVKIHEDDIEFYNMNYKGKLFCSACKQAALTLRANAKTPHLSTLKNTKHKKGCDFEVKVGTNSQTTNYIENVNNKEQVGRKLDSLLDRMFDVSKDKNKETIGTLKQKNTEDEKLTFEINNKGMVERKAFPRKRIDSLFRKDEDDKGYVMYYGEVFMEIGEVVEKKKESSTYHVVNIKIYILNHNTKKRTYVCSLGIFNENIEPILEKLQFVENNTMYKIAFIGKIKGRKVNGFRLNSCTINHPEFLKVK